jgi:hypothetical protein
LQFVYTALENALWYQAGHAQQNNSALERLFAGSIACP